MTAFTPAPADPPANVDIPSRRTDSQDAFDDKTDTYMGWLSRFRAWLAEFRAWLITARAEIGAVGDGAVSAASTATTQADLAMGYRNTAGNHATAAGQSKDTAVNAAATASQQAALADTARQLTQQARETTYQYRQDALGANEAAGLAKLAAQVARDQAMVFATQQLKATSATSLVPGVGLKTFAIEPGRSFVRGMYLVATSVGAPQNQLSGPVDSYNIDSGALVLAADKFSGNAARVDWVIGVAVPNAEAPLTRKVVVADELCVAGVCYVVAAPGVTLTHPAQWTPKQRIAFVEAIGDGSTYTMVFTCPVRGKVMGTQIFKAQYTSSGELMYLDGERGLT